MDGGQSKSTELELQDNISFNIINDQPAFTASKIMAY